MTDPTPAQVLAQMTVFLTSQQSWVNQMKALVTGTAGYTSGPVGGVNQPNAGYYPLTDPSGVTVWQPSIARIQADAGIITTEGSPALTTQTATAAQSGKVIKVNGPGGTNAVKIILPPNLGANWNAVYYWEGQQVSVTFEAGSGATILQDQSLLKMRSRYSMVTVWAVSNSVFVISGSMTN